MRRDVFQAIADPTRRAIIMLIAVKALTPNAIAEHFETTRQAVSRHLKILVECGLIKHDQHGREIFYTLNPDKMLELDKWLEEFRQLWNKRFDALDNVLVTIKKIKKMSKNLTYDFSVNKHDRTITIQRDFAAELPLVWDAYTKSELLDQWWAPQPWKAKTKLMDFREGGTWLYAMLGPEGEEHWSIALYKTIQNHKQFTGLDAFTDSQGNVSGDMPQSSWIVDFVDKHGITTVNYHIIYDDLAQLETTIQMGFKEGITEAMKGLDRLLASLE